MEVKEELVSVIIPVYNVEKYLKKCIETAMNQTYKNIEIILIDDGSTDRSGEICDAHKEIDERIVVIHQENKGLAAVRNRGLEIAKGKYIFWLDSDDYVSCSIIKDLYINLVQSGAQISICGHIKGENRDFEFLNFSEEVEIFDWKKGLELIYKNQEYAFIMVAVWAKLIEKSLYENIQFPEGKLFEDIYVSHKVISRCNTIVLSQNKHYYYYQNMESILGKKLSIKKLDYLGAFEERISFFKEKGLNDLSEKARIQYLHALIWEYSRAKDILHDQEMVLKIKKEYRKYYRLGTENRDIKHETKWYMFCFFVWPYGQDFVNKVKAKLKGI